MSHPIRATYAMTRVSQSGPPLLFLTGAGTDRGDLSLAHNLCAALERELGLYFTKYLGPTVSQPGHLSSHLLGTSLYLFQSTPQRNVI
jgi:hypothetical protein